MITLVAPDRDENVRIHTCSSGTFLTHASFSAYIHTDDDDGFGPFPDAHAASVPGNVGLRTYHTGSA